MCVSSIDALQILMLLVMWGVFSMCYEVAAIITKCVHLPIIILKIKCIIKLNLEPPIIQYGSLSRHSLPLFKVQYSLVYGLVYIFNMHCYMYKQ